jgi:hypothetical protein
VRVPLAAAVVPALAVAMPPVEFTYAPLAALVTFTVTVQLPLAGTVAPEIARLVPLLAPVSVGEPPQVVDALAVAVFTRLAG